MYLRRAQTRRGRRQAGKITSDCLPVNEALQQQCFPDFPPPPLNMAERILARSQAAVDINREFADRRHEGEEEEERRGVGGREEAPSPLEKLISHRCCSVGRKKKYSLVLSIFFPLLSSYAAGPIP